MSSDPEKVQAVRGDSIPSTLDDSMSISTDHTSHSSHHDDGTRALTPQASRTTNKAPALSRTRTATSIGTQGTSAPEFEIDWDGDDDPENPRNWPTWYKGIVVALISFSTWV